MGTYSEFLESLGARESSGNYGVVNRYGYLGKYQMGESGLIASGYYLKDGTKKNDWNGDWTGKDGVYSELDFLTNHQAQENAIRAYIDKQWSWIKNFKLDQYIGRTINGVLITESGLIAAAHLGGIGNLIKYLKGKNDFRDGNGTAISSYMKKFGGYDLGLSGQNIAPEPLPLYYTAADAFLVQWKSWYESIRSAVAYLFERAHIGPRQAIAARG